MDPDPISLLILVILSGIFSSLEIAFFSLSEAKVQALIDQKVRGAKRVQRLKKNSDFLLVTILLGNNIVNITASAMATVMATEYFGSQGTGIAVGIMTILILIFGEITPKSLATRLSVQIATSFAVIIQALQWILYPIIWVFVQINYVFTKILGESQDTVSEEEIEAMSRIGMQDGSIEKHEHKLIRNIFDLSEKTVEDIMTPRINMQTFQADITLDRVIKDIVQGEFSRYPVFEDTTDNITGILYIRDIIKIPNEEFANHTLKSLAKPPIFTPALTNIYDLFEKMNTKQTHIAIVTDEHGGIDGLVTMEDILEEIVGEINDETDEPENMVLKQSHNTWLINGNAELKILEDILSTEFEDGNKTVSAFITEEIGHLPKKGELLHKDTYTMKVTKADEKMIKSVRLTVTTK